MNAPVGVTGIELVCGPAESEINAIARISFFDAFDIYPFKLRHGSEEWLQAPMARSAKEWRALFEPLDIERNDLFAAVSAAAKGESLLFSPLRLTTADLAVRYRPHAGRDGLTGFCDVTIAGAYFLHSIQVFDGLIRGPRPASVADFSAIRLRGDGRPCFEEAFAEAIGRPDARWEECPAAPAPALFFKSKAGKKRPIPLEKMAAHDRGFLGDADWIIGVDEVGTGAIAGPIAVGAAACSRKMLSSPPSNLLGITDSKMLGEEDREKYGTLLRERIEYEVEMMSAEEFRSSMAGGNSPVRVCQARAIARLLERLSGRPRVLVDAGPWTPQVDAEVVRIPGGDRVSLAIASAAILAKTTRDAEMRRLAHRHPEYRWEKNKGYLTPEHTAALREHGETAFHRKALRI